MGMIFPITDLLDDGQSETWLLEHFHPEGLRCAPSVARRGAASSDRPRRAGSPSTAAFGARASTTSIPDLRQRDRTPSGVGGNRRRTNRANTPDKIARHCSSLSLGRFFNSTNSPE